jgi:dienelactone hydrolase
MAGLGARTRIVTLWLYAESDSLFAPETVERMREAYAKAGGQAELRMAPRIIDRHGHTVRGSQGGTKDDGRSTARNVATSRPAGNGWGASSQYRCYGCAGPLPGWARRASWHSPLLQRRVPHWE